MTTTISDAVDHDRRQRSSTGAAVDSIRPYRVDVPGAALADLRQRLAMTRLPEKETVADQSQGVQLDTIQRLLRYWQTDYDWRRIEAKLNALPNFITAIDGLDIHFIHVRSKYDALPLIVTHGWPTANVVRYRGLADRPGGVFP